MRAAVTLVLLALAGCGGPKVVFENSITVPENISDIAPSNAAR